MESSSATSPSSMLTPAERLRRSEEEGRALVAGWRASGKSQRAYAQEVGVRAQRLSYWRLRLSQREAPAMAEGGFVEIAPRLCAGAGIVIELPGGVRLRAERGFDAEVLRSVVAALVGPGARPC